jgi:hypothetical protein
MRLRAPNKCTHNLTCIRDSAGASSHKSHSCTSTRVNACLLTQTRTHARTHAQIHSSARSRSLVPRFLLPRTLSSSPTIGGSVNPRLHLCFELGLGQNGLIRSGLRTGRCFRSTWQTPSCRAARFVRAFTHYAYWYHMCACPFRTALSICRMLASAMGIKGQAAEQASCSLTGTRRAGWPLVRGV